MNSKINGFWLRWRKKSNKKKQKKAKIKMIKNFFRTTVPSDIVKVLKDENLYDRHASPTQNMGIPTNVSIQMYIEGLSSFQAQSMVKKVSKFSTFYSLKLLIFSIMF